MFQPLPLSEQVSLSRLLSSTNTEFWLLPLSSIISIPVTLQGPPDFLLDEDCWDLQLYDLASSWILSLSSVQIVIVGLASLYWL